MVNPKARGWITALGMLASVFLAGLLAGAAVVELRGSTRDEEPRREARDRDGRGFSGRRGGGMMPLLPQSVLDELGLSEEQRAGVEEILQRRGTETRAILESMGPRLRAQVDSGHTEVRALLDPGQQEIFDRIHQEMRNRRSRGAPGFGPRGTP
jgi:hypothetical protein